MPCDQCLLAPGVDTIISTFPDLPATRSGWQRRPGTGAQTEDTGYQICAWPIT